MSSSSRPLLRAVFQLLSSSSSNPRDRRLLSRPRLCITSSRLGQEETSSIIVKDLIQDASSIITKGLLLRRLIIITLLGLFLPLLLPSICRLSVATTLKSSSIRPSITWSNMCRCLHPMLQLLLTTITTSKIRADRLHRSLWTSIIITIRIITPMVVMSPPLLPWS